MQNILNQIHRYNKQELEVGQPFKIVLQPKQKEEVKDTIEPIFQPHTEDKMIVGNKYTITVKKYMTEPGNASFDFMQKWNNNIPMPLVIMTGKVIKETRGMVFMELEGNVKPTHTCICCGKPLTNPISMIYGIGPECGRHFYINPFSTEEELQEHIEEIRNTICNIKWTGWVIKSAIKEFKEEN